MVGAEKMVDLTTRNVDDENFESHVLEQLDQFLALHFRAVLKAPLIGLMMLFSIYVITGSVSKGLSVSSICVLISLFTTWRRFLEPISFAVFCLAVIDLCHYEMAAHVALAGH